MYPPMSSWHAMGGYMWDNTTQFFASALPRGIRDKKISWKRTVKGTLHTKTDLSTTNILHVAFSTCGHNKRVHEESTWPPKPELQSTVLEDTWEQFESLNSSPGAGINWQSEAGKEGGSLTLLIAVRGTCFIGNHPT